MPIENPVGGRKGLEDCQNQSEETETSLVLSQMSMDWGLAFVDWDPRSYHGRLDNAAGVVASQMRNHLSLNQQDSQSREAGSEALGVLEETSGQHDGANTMKGA